MSTVAARTRLAVADTCRSLRSAGLVVGTAGNVSAREGDLLAISPSGVDYAGLTADDICVCDLTGRRLDGPYQPSSELPLHLAVYTSSSASAIVHTHAPASTALSVLVDEVPDIHYYNGLFGGQPRVAPYATFGSAELAANVSAALEDRTAALMSNHGAVVTAGTLNAAVEKAQYLEYVCDVALRVLATRLPARRLPPGEMPKVIAALAGYGSDNADD